MFLWMREGNRQLANQDIEECCKRQGLKDRLIGTVSGKVRYFRTYIYRGKFEAKDG